MSAQKTRRKNSSEGRTHRKRGRKKVWNRKAIFCWGVLAVGLLIVLLVLFRMPDRLQHSKNAGSYAVSSGKVIEERPVLEVDLLDVNPYSRPGIELKQVKGIVVHYTANPGSTAKQNRDYFEGLATEHTTKASSHFVIGLDGEIVQCIPCNEISYASNDRNSDTISIECCHEDESGQFNKKTYQSLVELVSWLVCRYDLAVDDVIRHYDVTGKICPKYFVDEPEAWEAFKSDVAEYIEENGK